MYGIKLHKERNILAAAHLFEYSLAYTSPGSLAAIFSIEHKKIMFYRSLCVGKNNLHCEAHRERCGDIKQWRLEK